MTENPKPHRPLWKIVWITLSIMLVLLLLAAVCLFLTEPGEGYGSRPGE
jgi:hypothetical protein